MEQLLHRLPELATAIHDATAEKGFWPTGNQRDKNEVLALIASEVYEALEAERKGRVTAEIERYKAFAAPANVYPEMTNDYQESIIAGNRENFIKSFQTHVKDTAADELADVMVRCLDAIGGYGLDANKVVVYIKNWTKSKIVHPNIAGLALFTGWMGYSITQGTEITIGIAAIMAETMHIAGKLEIPLLWHIEEKLKYNATRAAKHGKLF